MNWQDRFGGHWHAPLDPECPAVQQFHETTLNDPMMASTGCADEFLADFEAKHRPSCQRCLEYGVANIEVAT